MEKFLFFKDIFLKRKNFLCIFVIFISMFLILIIKIIYPKIIMLLLDKAILGKNIMLLLKLIILYFILCILQSFIEYVLEYLNNIVKNKISVYLRLKVLKKISNQNGEYYSNIKTGEIMNILEDDISTIENTSIKFILSIIFDIITVLVSVFILINMNKSMFIFVLTIQLLSILIQKKITYLIYLKSDLIRDYNGKISSLNQELISNIKDISILRLKNMFIKKYIHLEKNRLDLKLKTGNIVSISKNTSSILNNISLLFIYGYGGYNIILGNMSIGEIISFQQYTALLVTPIINLIESMLSIQQANISVERIIRILKLKDPYTISNNRNLLFNSIYFENVDFYYEDNKKILDNVNLEFNKGKMIGIVGENGSGKTTISNLILRLWDCNQGEIKIDGTNIKNFNINSLRKNISIVTQNIFIFDDTLLNNITCGKKINESYLKDICQKLDLDSLIKSLPKGLETNLGEKGIKLSGGEKQKIATARALLLDSKVIIFDESTSALDNISQEKIIKNIKIFLENKISIVISHKLYTIKDADRIYIMKNGKVIGDGIYNDLLKDKSFSKLFEHEYSSYIK